MKNKLTCFIVHSKLTTFRLVLEQCRGSVLKIDRIKNDGKSHVSNTSKTISEISSLEEDVTYVLTGKYRATSISTSLLTIVDMLAIAE